MDTFQLFFGMLLANEETPEVTTLFEHSDDYWKSIVYTFVILIIIIALIVLVIKFLAQRDKRWLSNRAIRSLSGIPLGQNKSIHIVEIGSSLYIVGVGDDVQLLDKISDEALIQDIKQSLQPVETAWSSNLNRIFARFQVRDDGESEDELSFQEVFNDKMERIKRQKSEVEHILTNEIHDERNSKL